MPSIKNLYLTSICNCGEIACNSFCGFVLVLGNHLRWAWNRPHRSIPWRLRPPTREDQRLLQRSIRWQICSPCYPGGPGARYHGLSQVRTLRPDLQARQLCFRSERCWQQLGKGPLHRGCWARRLSAWCRQERGWELRLLTGIVLSKILIFIWISGRAISSSVVHFTADNWTLGSYSNKGQIIM